MIENQAEDKCALPRCTCSVPKGELYCCDECRRDHANPDEQSEECPCGHADCSSTGPSGGVVV